MTKVVQVPGQPLAANVGVALRAGQLKYADGRGSYMTLHLLVAAQGDVENEVVVVEVGFAGRDGQIG